MIKMENGCKYFGKLEIFSHADLDISRSGLYIIKGESGSGKSTLLNILAGFEPLTDGSLTVSENKAMIFQNYELIQRVNVEENIFLSKPRQKTAKEQALLDELGLTPLLNHYPNELSGGQKQRVGIARALLMEPDVILCDEPTESLDIENKIIVMNLLQQLAKEKIVLVVTHDEEMIRSYGETIYVIEDHRIKLRDKSEKESIEVYDHPIKKVENTDLTYLIHRMLFKRTVLFSLLFTLLFAASVFIYTYTKVLFYIPDTAYILNHDRVYITADLTIPRVDENGREVDPQTYALTEVRGATGIANVRTIVPFYAALINQRTYRVCIGPIIEDEQFPLEKPLTDGVIVNQNCISFYEEENPESITLLYKINSMEYSYEAKIQGTIEEKDASWCSVYYNLDTVMSDLEKETLSSGETVAGSIMSSPDTFEGTIPFDEIEKKYEKVSERNDVSITNPLIDERIRIREDSKVFKLLFNGVTILAFVLVFILLIFYLIKEAGQFLKDCSILISYGVPVARVKSLYTKEKGLPFTIIFLVGTLLFMLALFLMDPKIILLQDKLLILACAAVFLLLSFAMIPISLRSLQRDNISNIFKQD